MCYNEFEKIVKSTNVHISESVMSLALPTPLPQVVGSSRVPGGKLDLR